jgi:hypothetical protein
MENTDKIFDWLDLLKSTPKMIVSGPKIDYLTLSVYLDGYLDGLGAFLNRNFRNEIRIWFDEKNGVVFPIGLPDIIPIFYKDKTEDELKEILVDTIKQYFKENPVENE